MITEEQLNSLKESGDILDPIPLAELVDPDLVWVYHRDIGVIPVLFGSHEFVMGELEAMLQGYKGGFDYPHLGWMELAELFLQREGTAYASSVGECVWVGASGNINAIERRIFSKVYIDIRVMF
jgi:hypothetical protein